MSTRIDAASVSPFPPTVVVPDAYSGPNGAALREAHAAVGISDINQTLKAMERQPTKPSMSIQEVEYHLQATATQAFCGDETRYLHRFVKNAGPVGSYLPLSVVSSIKDPSAQPHISHYQECQQIASSKVITACRGPAGVYASCILSARDFCQPVRNVLLECIKAPPPEEP